MRLNIYQRVGFIKIKQFAGFHLVLKKKNYFTASQILSMRSKCIVPNDSDGAYYKVSIGAGPFSKYFLKNKIKITNLYLIFIIYRQRTKSKKYF